MQRGTEQYGKAFENWVHHELVTCRDYRETYSELSFWRLSSGAEVDFVIDDMRVAIEAKSSRKVTRDHLKGLRALREDHPGIGHLLVVCQEKQARLTEDGIEILPAGEFARRLWDGEIIG